MGTTPRLIPDEPLVIEQEDLALALLSHCETQRATKGLIDSIARFGVLQPILVRSDGTRYDIVDGRRRLDAARTLSLPIIPAMVAVTDLAISDVATLAMNATRASNPVAEYDAVIRLIQQGFGEKEIAGATGMSRQTIRARLLLGHLVDELTTAFRQGKISVTVAEGAARLGRVLQLSLVFTYRTKGKLTEADLHAVRTAATQQQMAMLPTTLFDEETLPPGEAVASEPMEAGLARELQSIIDRLPPEQGTYRRTLAWVATGLLDIAMGQSDWPDEGAVLYDDKDGNRHVLTQEGE